MIKIWHNPRCSKSRESLKYIQEQTSEVEITEYLKETPNKNEIQKILDMLKIPASKLLRKSESIYKELNLKDETNEAKLIDAMVKNPKLIERPIVIKDNIAVIGRPIENVINLLKEQN